MQEQTTGIMVNLDTVEEKQNAYANEAVLLAVGEIVAVDGVSGNKAQICEIRRREIRIRWERGPEIAYKRGDIIDIKGGRFRVVSGGHLFVWLKSLPGSKLSTDD